MEEQEYKCTRCLSYKTKKYFGEYINGQRNKVCRKCAKEDKIWEREKKTFKYDESIEWKKHPIYGEYVCNENGYVVDTKTKKLIGEITQAGYICLKLNISGEKITSGHRFVCETWIGPIPEKYVVNHINQHIKHQKIQDVINR